MRRVIWVFVVLALGWSGWWVWAAARTEDRVADWFEARRAEGWQADYSAFEITGFPLSFEAEVQLPALADPQTGVAVTASALRVAAPAWWPGDLTLMLPPDDIVFASPVGRTTLVVTEGIGALSLRPGTDLALAHLTLDARSWVLGAQSGDLLLGDSLSARFALLQNTPDRYVLSADAAGFRPGPVLRTQLRIPDDWPLSFERFGLAMQVTFDRPWDRRAVEVARPQPRQIQLDLAEVVWGQLSLRAAADLEIDASGIASGTVSMQARNWREMLTLAGAAGVLPEAVAPQAETVLAALARATGDPTSIDVTLTVRDGLVLLGFVPLARLPPLILR
ncbi:DUF2125 domain-containing protein [uncultured Roseobacter sp.]|uniref:DUF2125 domain-containing protein n=1 Tax=uncultured Roseobacter sp. TaxID=114847 RepID=UPI00261A36F3|nr:DUF2125 domain-containing protein [uncultured Roseobacter sp.]